MKRKLAAVAIAGALAVGLAACGDDDDDEPTAEQVYCGAVAQLESDVDELVSLDPRTVSIDDIEQARDTIEEDLTAVVEAAGDVNEEQVGEVQDAYQNLEEGIEALSGDETLSEAFQALAPDVARFLASLEGLDAVDCDEVDAVTTEE